MPYAKENMVSQDFVEGGIEITDTEYDDAITAMTRGQNIAIRNGKMKVLSLETKIVYDVVNGTPLEIPENDDVPNGYTLIQKPDEWYFFDGNNWVIDIEKLKLQKIKEINETFEKELAKGFTTSAGITLNSKLTDYQFYFVGKERAKAKLAKGTKSPAIARVKDHNGVVHKDIPVSDYIAMVEELEEHLESLWYKKIDLEEQIMTATTAEELEAVKWE
jgi:hypothetical protein